ncbi:MAG: CO dehydrogenase/CO-methylating acetyl-CoA synthase complex subunit beta [Chloroflexota bacterium]|nr:MAG: CO dehydrogenase/CO-methylating acetyl-CoA synthase complex subunit beta [Chloroflexota bacterium]
MLNSIDIFSAADSADSAKARQQGLAFIDGSIPGYALLMGDDINQALPILEALTQRQIMVFVVEETLQNALQDAGVALGWDTHVIPLSMPKSLGCIARVAQTFGNINTEAETLTYARERLLGFTILAGNPSPERLDLAQRALSLGCPLLTTGEVPLLAGEWQIPPTGNIPPGDIVQLGIEERGMRINVPIPALPVTYSDDFAGQMVREDACGACLSGVELVVTGESPTDEEITILGPDVDSLTGKDFALLIEVSGREMKSDFEPVVEREIEVILSKIDGVMHRGQRDMVTLNISQKAIDKGLTLRHLGEILHAQIHNEFGMILSRVQVTVITEKSEITAIREQAEVIYQKRDSRLNDLTDEDVDVFYTCNSCQTIAEGHLCVISPERPGVCGAVDWMDARAAVSINPHGHNKEVAKEGLIDAKLGQWESVNQIVKKETGGAITAFSLYSLMQDPGTACGDFEAITAMLPVSNGVMVFDISYKEMTPIGMDWTMLSEMIGAGAPMPGFLGHSKRAIQREKFISAEGGWRRIVWMNHSLREELRPALEALASAAGVSGFVDMISTEQNALSEDEVMEYMSEVGHPALSMNPMM